MITPTTFYIVTGLALTLSVIVTFLAYRLHKLGTTSPQPPEQPEQGQEEFELYQELQSRTGQLELEMAELEEFVKRGMKRMSARHQRAEMANQVMQESQAIDQQQQGHPQGELYAPNGRARIVRR